MKHNLKKGSVMKAIFEMIVGGLLVASNSKVRQPIEIVIEVLLK